MFVFVILPSIRVCGEWPITTEYGRNALTAQSYFIGKETISNMNIWDRWLYLQKL